MIYTPSQYCKIFKLNNHKVCSETIRRRIAKGQLPSNHKVNKLPGKNGGFVIEVPDKK